MARVMVLKKLKQKVVVGVKKLMKKAKTKAVVLLFGCYTEAFEEAPCLDIMLKLLIQKFRLYPQSISIRFSFSFSWLDFGDFSPQQTNIK